MTSPAPASPAAIDTLLDRTREALAALAAKRKAAQRKIGDLLASGQDKQARATQDAASVIDGDIAFEETRLAALEVRRAEAEAAEACAAQAERLAIACDIAAKRMEVSGKAEKAIAALGNAVASLDALSAELGHALAAMPAELRPALSRPDHDVFHGLPYSLIAAGLGRVVANYDSNDASHPGLAERMALAHRFLTSIAASGDASTSNKD